MLPHYLVKNNPDSRQHTHTHTQHINRLLSEPRTYWGILLWLRLTEHCRQDTQQIEVIWIRYVFLYVSVMYDTC